MIVENDVTIEDYGIRRLTPRECWRLMDFSDSDFDKAKAAGMSATQVRLSNAANAYYDDGITWIWKIYKGLSIKL